MTLPPVRLAKKLPFHNTLSNNAELLGQLMQENTIPWIIKIIPAIVGAILALVLSGDIDKKGKIQVTVSVICKFAASVTVSLYGGSAFIEHFEMLKTSTMYQGFIMLMFAVFGLLAIGIVYQAVAMWRGKSLPEVIAEIKAAFLAILGKGE